MQQGQGQRRDFFTPNSVKENEKIILNSYLSVGEFCNLNPRVDYVEATNDSPPPSLSLSFVDCHRAEPDAQNALVDSSGIRGMDIRIAEGVGNQPTNSGMISILD